MLMSQGERGCRRAVQLSVLVPLPGGAVEQALGGTAALLTTGFLSATSDFRQKSSGLTSHN